MQLRHTNLSASSICFDKSVMKSWITCVQKKQFDFIFFYFKATKLPTNKNRILQLSKHTNWMNQNKKNSSTLSSLKSGLNWDQIGPDVVI